MTFLIPSVLVAAAIAVVALGAAVWLFERRRRAATERAGIPRAGGPLRRAFRVLPAMLIVAGIGVLLVSAARPQAVVPTARAAGTVILAFDVSASMQATDVSPSRLEAAKEAAAAFIEAQPDTVDVGVVAFAKGALTTLEPTADRSDALAAVDRLETSGATSIGQAILTSLSTITGEEVTLPSDDAEGTTDIGYWGSATIVVFSDGEETADPDAVSAAAVAATAGVHIDTIGVGTTDGTTIEVDGYQVSTALDEEALTQIAETASGEYHALSDASDVDGVASTIDLRLTVADEEIEITAIVGCLGLLLVAIGSVLMVSRNGRLV
ncbi:MAG: VWA domain-containing protein [Microbacterium sp.]|uniref:VWA domain-containing protein n=1 Tax=Microbacterium sp. TaxID=51671 RepID=UPI0039E47153